MSRKRSTKSSSSPKPSLNKPKREPQLLRPKTANQAIFMRSIDTNDFVICDAIAGTGKTTIAVGMACKYFLSGQVEKIILCRPLAQCGPGAGFLPGDINNKALPFMHPVLDALDTFLGDSVTRNIAEKNVVVTPLETLRGGNLHNCFIILDEMQNATYQQLKMLATRVGEGSKMVFVGDMSQSDVNKYYFNNTQDIQEKFFDNIRGEEGIDFVSLTADDIIRSRIAKIVATKCP